MAFRGHLRNGVVVPDEPIDLPEGSITPPPKACDHDIRTGEGASKVIQTIRTHATVKAGGTIEIRNAALPEGAVAEVIVMIETRSNGAALPPLSSFSGACRGVYGSADEIDRYLGELRDEWDRQ